MVASLYQIHNFDVTASPSRLTKVKLYWIGELMYVISTVNVMSENKTPAPISNTEELVLKINVGYSELAVIILLGYDSDFDDLGFVDIWSDESDTITEILTLKNTTRDKIAYTVRNHITHSMIT